MIRRSAEMSDDSLRSPSSEFADEPGRQSHPQHPTKKQHSHTSGRLACDICREREWLLFLPTVYGKEDGIKLSTLGKVRCDRADPKCGRCARLDYDCSYRGRKRHRATYADLPRQLSQVQDRLGAVFDDLRSDPAI